MTPRSPHEPVTLYQGPSVTLFRGWSLLVLVLVCVGMGAALHELWPRLDAWLWPPRHPPVVAPVQHVVPRATLEGPVARETFPPAEATVVNVWLQGCADCMPTFEAWAKLRKEGALANAPVVNVAYGTADVSWSERYQASSRLVFDAGDVFVRPLGISTFTTLLVDTNGHVLLRDSPLQPGFVDRLSAALEVARHFEAIEAARKLGGSWQGSYTCLQGITALTLDVALNDSQALVAVFRFGAHPENPGLPSGSFHMKGRYDHEARALSFSAEESDWIERPNRYITVGLNGAVGDGTFAGDVVSDGCTTFQVTRAPD